jgi:hypothetical protein
VLHPGEELGVLLWQSCDDGVHKVVHTDLFHEQVVLVVLLLLLLLLLLALPWLLLIKQLVPSPLFTIAAAMASGVWCLAKAALHGAGFARV